MRILFALISALSLGLAVSSPAYALYNILLSNGQEIQADSYKIENGKITLKYKVGEVSFPKDKVKSITDESGKVGAFSTPAAPVQKPAEQVQRVPAPKPVPISAPPLDQPVIVAPIKPAGPSAPPASPLAPKPAQPSVKAPQVQDEEDEEEPLTEEEQEFLDEPSLDEKPPASITPVH